nr:BRCA1-associated RING domain protein 1-like isoform X2 [Lolium perenne]
MRNEAVASQSSSHLQSSLAGNKNTSLAKGPYKRVRADATKVASPGVNASNTEENTEENLHPCKKSKGLGKHGKLEDNEDATELRRPPTPINVFEDECVFCHSFRTSEKFHGPMVMYRKGRIVSSNEGNPNNVMYVHQNCMYWAPKVYLDGDDIVNMEKEKTRGSRLKCSRCRLPGAVLGCYHDPCANTYHAPCARMIPECHSDAGNHYILCPKHSPCDKKSSQIVESGIILPILQNQCLDKQGMHVVHSREDQQVDQPNTLTSLPQGQCSDKGGLSSNYHREEKQTNQSSPPVNQWVLLGSVLSAFEKDSLKEFASLTSSNLAEKWDKNVTHVIVGRSASNSCGSSYEVLMAILSGKWVVRAEWIVDFLAEPIPGPKTCLAEPITVPEISYEVQFYYASHKSIDGPKKGRAGTFKRAPKLFSGLHFCLSAYMNTEDSENIKNLIAAAEGQVLEAMSPHSLKENLEKDPAKVYFIYVGGPASTSFVGKEKEANAYMASGAQVICHLWLFDAIAAYDVRMLDRSDGFTPDVYANSACYV